MRSIFGLQEPKQWWDAASFAQQVHINAQYQIARRPTRDYGRTACACPIIDAVVLETGSWPGHEPRAEQSASRHAR